jgi:hypothetical protein
MDDVQQRCVPSVESAAVELAAVEIAARALWIARRKGLERCILISSVQKAESSS